MTPEYVTELLQRATLVAIYVAGPLLIAGLLAGLVLGIVQAVTQVQESSLVFVPKLLAVLGVVVGCAPWLLEQLVGLVRFSLDEVGHWHGGAPW